MVARLERTRGAPQRAKEAVREQTRALPAAEPALYKAHHPVHNACFIVLFYCCCMVKYLMTETRGHVYWFDKIVLYITGLGLKTFRPSVGLPAAPSRINIA